MEEWNNSSELSLEQVDEKKRSVGVAVAMRLQREFVIELAALCYLELQIFKMLLF